MNSYAILKIPLKSDVASQANNLVSLRMAALIIILDTFFLGFQWRPVCM